MAGKFVLINGRHYSSISSAKAHAQSIPYAGDLGFIIEEPVKTTCRYYMIMVLDLIIHTD